MKRILTLLFIALPAFAMADALDGLAILLPIFLGLTVSLLFMLVIALIYYFKGHHWCLVASLILFGFFTLLSIFIDFSLTNNPLPHWSNLVLYPVPLLIALRKRKEHPYSLLWISIVVASVSSICSILIFSLIDARSYYEAIGRYFNPFILFHLLVFHKKICIRTQEKRGV